MTAHFVRSALVAVALLLPACALAAVETTVDPDVDIAKFRTFVFLDSAPNADGAVTDKGVRSRLQRILSRRMGTKGYMPAKPGAGADLGVHFTGCVTEKQSVLVVGRPGPYDYNWGGRREIGGTDTLDYKQGTLFVDIVDLGANRLVFRTRITEALTSNFSEDNWAKVEKALVEAFKKLPQRAGSTKPK